jgi:CubicO group peptidase (beta-lactamase class C family)
MTCAERVIVLPQKNLVVFLVIVLSACSTPPKKPQDTQRGDYTYTKQYTSWLIEKEMADADVIGLSVALVDDQHVVWAQGFGYEDKQAHIKATSDTVYHLGSIAKVFTATAAMQLAEQGKLGLDQPLKKCLPEFSIKSRYGDISGITPRNIMTHHSGLPGFWARGMSERHPGPFTEQVAAIHEEYVAYPPNTVFAYSNLGVSLLGAAIGEVSGEGYASYMNHYLLQPLGMTHSEFAARIPGKAYKNGKEVEAIPLRDLPSSSLNSSASDMTHFMQMLFADGRYDSRQIVRPESLHEMFKVQNGNVPLDFDFKMGLGWMLSGVDVPGVETVLSHSGSTLNYHALLAVLPEYKLGVVVLSNSAGSEVAVAKVAEQMLKLALEAKRGIKQSEKPFVEPKKMQLSEADFRAYEGYFDTLIGLVKVENRKGDLIARLMDFDFELVKHESGEFGVRLKLLGFIPVANQQMKEMSLSLHRIGGREVLAYKKDGRSMLVGEKLNPQSLPEYLNDYVGEYDIANKCDGPLPENIRMIREGDMLIGEFRFSEKPGFVFHAVFFPTDVKGELIMAGIGSGKGETLRAKKIDGEAHLYFSGFDFKKISGKRGS